MRSSIGVKFFFHLGSEVEEVVEALRDGYIEHRESGVFCMRGIEAARRNRSYHSDGSELIRTISRRLGAKEEEMYLSAGRPCFIRILAPVEWFILNSRTSVDSLLRDLFTYWLWTELELDWPGDPRDGGIVFTIDVPPGFIDTFHYPRFGS